MARPRRDMPLGQPREAMQKVERVTLALINRNSRR
jgi:hypothetical protein